MLRGYSLRTVRFALIAWLFVGLAAVAANPVVESSQDRSAIFVLTDAQDFVQPGATPEPADGDLTLLPQFAHLLPQVVAHRAYPSPDHLAFNAPRKGWQGRAPPLA